MAAYDYLCMACEHRFEDRRPMTASSTPRSPARRAAARAAPALLLHREHHTEQRHPAHRRRVRLRRRLRLWRLTTLAPPATNLPRFRCVSVASLVWVGPTADHRVMDAQAEDDRPVAVAGRDRRGGQGVLGILLPAGERIAAGLALVVGAGVGVVALAIGTQIASDSAEAIATAVLAASALGLLATLLSLGVLWRRTADQRATGPRGADRRGDGDRPEAARTSAPSEG